MKTNHPLETIFSDHIRLVHEAKDPKQSQKILLAGESIVDSLRKGGKVLLCGNGGSAADALHFAAELVGRFERERKGYPAIALSTNPSILTSLANDYSFEEIFSRQVLAFGDEKDILIAISTSGSSTNVIRGAETAAIKKIPVIALTGKIPNPLADLSHIVLSVNSSHTARIQEIHAIFLHALAALIEKKICHAP
jgi:D-sedoheptulose 7-phosphate isomerase